MRPHKKLDVWKRSIDFVTKLYEVTESFPKSEKHGLVNQIRRAAVSIPSNIAEGAARKSNKEFAQFLSIAQGSASELETQLIISINLGFLREGGKELLAELEEISRMLLGLSKSI